MKAYEPLSLSEVLTAFFGLVNGLRDADVPVLVDGDFVKVEAEVSCQYDAKKRGMDLYLNVFFYCLVGVCKAAAGGVLAGAETELWDSFLLFRGH